MMTTAREARDLKERIYQLHIKGLTNSEIAGEIGIDRSNVIRHLAKMRRENIAWFEKHKDPDGRMRAYFKEVADELSEVKKEAWRQYHLALNPPAGEQAAGIKARIGYLQAILSAIQQYRQHLRMLAPSMDEIYFRQQMEELRRAIYEGRPASEITRSR